MSSNEKAAPPRGGIANRILAVLVGLYSLSNFLLFIFSCIAWSKTKKRADSTDCKVMGSINCGFTRWVLYSFMSAISLICFVCTAIMALNGLFRTKGCSLDPLYLFRGVFFTLLLLAPVIYIGWTGLTMVVDRDDRIRGYIDAAVSCSALGCSMNDFDAMLGCPKRPCKYDLGLSFGSLGGGFVLEQLDRDFKGSRAAYGMAHFNVLFGALVAGISAALALPSSTAGGNGGSPARG